MKEEFRSIFRYIRFRILLNFLSLYLLNLSHIFTKMGALSFKFSLSILRNAGQVVRTEHKDENSGVTVVVLLLQEIRYR